MANPKKDAQEPKKKRPPATSLEARENQLISLAVDLAEKQLLEGTASSQVISHYLKLGSTNNRIEREMLTSQNELLKAKTESLKSAARIEGLYDEAMKAFRKYSGNGDQDAED